VNMRHKDLTHCNMDTFLQAENLLLTYVQSQCFKKAAPS
jgi:hypothetical protein